MKHCGAERGYAAPLNGASEVHVTPNERHDSSADCWCEPAIYYRDPDTGVTVYQHRGVY